MKRVIMTAILALGVIMAGACPRPTGHFVLELGCQSDLLGLIQYNTNGPIPLGTTVLAAYETPMRWSTIGVRYSWINTDTHLVGVEYKANLIPMWVNSPVNLHVCSDLGYYNRGKGYTSIGLEFALGGNNSRFQWFVRDDFGCIFNKTNINKFDYISTGFRLWIGKRW